jgi:hypothetical protein
MLHDVLTPLLFKREELRSVPRSERAKAKDGSRITIASSPLYTEAVKKFYAQFTQNVEPLTPPPTHPSQPRAFPCPSPRYPASRPSLAAPSSSQSEEEGFILDGPDLSEAQRHPSPINPAAGPSSPSKGESIDIIELSED